MAHGLVCWKCGAGLEALSLPLSRRDECARCRAELHVCRMCVEYDVAVAKHCREPTAEEVRGPAPTSPRTGRPSTAHAPSSNGCSASAERNSTVAEALGEAVDQAAEA